MDATKASRISIDRMLRGNRSRMRFRCPREDRFFVMEQRQVRYKQRNAKVVTIQETTQEIEINEQALLKHVYEILHMTITHEIKTPLNAIILTTQQLCYTSLTKRQAKLLQINLVSAKQMLCLVNDLIDLYLIQKERFQAVNTPVNLLSSLRDMINIVSLQALEKRIPIEVEIDDYVPKVLVFDELRIRSVVQNLVMNAIKFTNQDGQININCFYDKSSSELQISVQDNGIGLSDEVKKRLFTMFKALTIRSNQTNRDDEESNLGDKQTSGPGLGLTFCKSMIERLGGRIWYDPEVKVGTIFHIKFPARAVTEEEVKSQVFGEKSTESILIEKLQRLQMRSDQNKKMRDGGRDTLNRTANNLVKSSNRTNSTLYDISSQERTARGNSQVSPEPLSKQRSVSSSLAPVNSSAQETVKDPQPKA